MNKKNLWLVLGAIGAALGVIAGASGAHIVEPIVTPETYVTYYKGVRYQMYHSFALIFVSIISSENQRKSVDVAGLLFLSGIICFSGSLYLIVFIDFEWILQWVTMTGGFLFTFGWISLAISGLKRKHT
jgi:uncharacterized membrane protein YgdD (TMEM256/DUF423 family)